MTLADFPPLNASLNALSTVFIASGWFFIRRRQYTAHVVCLCIAMATSAAFLTCYLIFHFRVEGHSIHFTHPGIIKPIYLTLLITHVMLAFTTVPLVASSVIPALRRRWGTHKAVSKWTMPIWLYVSVTGVIVYFMLYRWFPSDEIRTKLAVPVAAVGPVATAIAANPL